MRRWAVVPLLLVVMVALASCSDDDDPASDPDPTESPSAAKLSVDETVPDGCTVTPLKITEDVVVELMETRQDDATDGVTMLLRSADPNADSVRLEVRRTIGDCVAEATMTGPDDAEFDVLGLKVRLGGLGDSGDPTRSSLTATILAAG